MPFYFELTLSVFLIEIWITSNPIFSCGVSLGAQVSTSSSQLFSKMMGLCCKFSFFGNLIFAPTV